ncbi:MAG: ABC transporter permease [Variovorax sp.]|nr:MAG: ABC transporter permease [Variovorax sp.]
MLAALIHKEWLAMRRDLHGLAVMFLMPVAFIILMSLALKDVYSPPQTALRYAIDPQDRGAPAQLITQAWTRAHGPAEALPADWQAQLRRGALHYVIVLKPGLSDELDALSLPTEARVDLLTDAGIDGNLFNALRAELVGAAGEAKARTALTVPGGPPPSAGGSMQALVHAERFGGLGPRPSAVQQNVPAWLVFGMFFVVSSLSGLLMQERSSGTLGRLRSLGVSRAMLLASKAMPYLGVNAVQAVLMLAVGVWLMPRIGGDGLSLAGIHWGALGLVLGALSLAAVSLALALACVVRSHAQAATLGPMVNVLMAAVGGIMVPKFIMPPFMQRVAEWMPMNWGLEGLLAVLLRGGDVGAVWPYATRLAAFALAMLLLAAWSFRRPAP